MHRLPVASLALLFWATTARAQSSSAAAPTLHVEDAPPSAEPAPAAPAPQPTTPAPSGAPEGTPAPPSAPPPPPPATMPPPPPEPAGAAAAASASNAEQTPRCPCGPFVHRGFYLMIGSGAGHVSTFGNGPYGSASVQGFGMSSRIAIGGTLAPGLALAGVIQSATRMGSNFDGGPPITFSTTRMVNGVSQMVNSTLSGNASTTAFLLGLQVDWFPRPEDGWHLGASLGLGGVRVTDDTGNGISGISVGASVFGGYQFWIAPSWSLGLAATFFAVPTATLKDGAQEDSGYRMMTLSGGLEAEILYY